MNLYRYCSRGPNLVTDGLVLCLDAANTKSYPRSGTVWNDLSGNSNHAIIQGSPTFSSDNYGRWGGFSDSNWFNLDSKASLVNVTEGTVGGWVRFNDISSGNKVFLSYGGNGTGAGVLLQSEGTTTRKFEFANFGNGIIAPNRVSLGEAVSNLYVGTDTYMIGTYSPSVIKLYLNGIEMGSVNKGNNNSTSSQSYLRISNEFNRTGRSLNGFIYNVHIYNRALSGSEILQNFNATKGRFSYKT